MNNEILSKLKSVLPDAVMEKQVLDKETGKVSFEYAIPEHLGEIGRVYYTNNSLDSYTSYTEIESVAKRHNLPYEIL